MQKNTKNTKNTKDNVCFHYTVRVALNHEKTAERAQRIAKITPCIADTTSIK